VTLVLLLLPLALLLFGALLSALMWRHDRHALAAGMLVVIPACVIAGATALATLLHLAPIKVQARWSLPVGDVHLGLDPLAAFFLLCVALVSALAAIHGLGYFRHYLGQRRLAPIAIFFNLLVAGMFLVVFARDGVGFLVAWEIMSVAGYFLVTLDGQEDGVRRAGLVYLIASHLGVVCLFVFFALLAKHGSFDLVAAVAPPAETAGLCFLLALAGFGAKAGLWPVHIWLPETYAAAPGPVPGLMSGAMSKLGIYGLCRALTLLGPPPAWWGVVLLAIGGVSALVGVLHALAERDLKRSLAYSSIENLGIVAMGLGVGLIGQSLNLPAVTALGYAGALLHVLNHGLFKGLLFQAASNVQAFAGTRSLESLGGLGRRAPLTAASFLVGAAAISGLPVLNGFVSEWLIYLGAFQASSRLPAGAALGALFLIPALGLVGGLAAACFVRLYGLTFLGHPRTTYPADRDEGPWSTRVAPAIAALLCLVIGIWPQTVVRLVERGTAPLASTSALAADQLRTIGGITTPVLVLLGVIGALAALRWSLLRRREVSAGATWGCGYQRPTLRMQYTAGSFADPLLAPFLLLLHRRQSTTEPEGYFPATASHDQELSDLTGERVLLPAASFVLRQVQRLRVIQQGRIQVYLGYVLAALLVLLVWQLAGTGR
jgi:hydrogenase-4 component B